VPRRKNMADEKYIKSFDKIPCLLYGKKVKKGLRIP
jgi:hypothetical protein